MDIKKEKYLNFLKKSLIYFLIFIFSFLCITFLLYNHYLLFIILFSAIIFLSLKFNIKHFAILLFIISFISKLIFIKLFNFEQISDFKVLLDASFKFAKKDYSFSNDLYFKLWAYQTGFVAYQGLLLKIFKNIFILKILNIIYTSFLTVYIYLFGKELVSKKAAVVASLLYLIFPFPMFLNTILANHHISAFLMYIGIFLLLKNQKKLSNYILAGILVGIGNIMRPEAIIVIFSYFVYWLFNLKKCNVKKSILYLLVFIICYISIGSLSSYVIKISNINNNGLTNNDPKWKFVLGFNHKSCGEYDFNDEQYLNNEKLENAVIKERVFSDPLKTIKLFSCKTNSFWLKNNLGTNNEEYLNKEFNLFKYRISYRKIMKEVNAFNYLIYIITFIMMLIGIIKNIKNIINSKSLYFLFLIITTFCVYLLIEIQARYAYFIYISIFILSCYGYDYLLNIINKKVNKIKKSKANKLNKI